MHMHMFLRVSENVVEISFNLQLFYLTLAGSLHCVACTDTGEVYTWGDNDEGQLGDGTTIAAQRPRLLVAMQVSLISQSITITLLTKFYKLLFQKPKFCYK